MRLAGDAARSWRSLPALYREHAVFVTASADQAREQIASGARVIGPIGSGTDAGTVRGQLEAARGGRPAGLAEVRAGCGTSSSTTRRPPGWPTSSAPPISRPTWCAGRQIAVLARVADAGRGRAAGVGAARPAAPAGRGDRRDAGRRRRRAVREALGKLTDHDIRVVVTPSTATPAGAADGSSRDLDWTRPLARLASAPWLAPWTGRGRRRGPADRTCSTWPARGSARRRTRSGSARGEYEFTHWLEQPALVRAALLAPGGPAAGDWGSHGLRLFTITA